MTLISPNVLLENITILEGIRTGDEVILKNIFSTYKMLIMNILRKSGAKPQESEDVFITALEAIYEKLQTKELTLDKASFKSYFIKICLFQWNKIKYRKKFLYSVTLENIEVFNENEDLTEELLIADQYKLLRAKLAQITGQCQQILIWFFIDEKSTKEIAMMLNITEGNVRKKKFDCKTRLFKLIQSDSLYKELKL